MKHFKHLTNKETVLSLSKVSHVPINFRPEAKFIPSLIDDFLFKLSNFELRGNEYDENLMSTFFETFIEFLIDLLVQLPTRRFINNILEDQAVLIRCKMSELFMGTHMSNLFGRLVELLQFYLKFELNNHTGEPYHDEDIFRLQCSKNQTFQRISFKLGTNLRELSLLKCADVSNRELLSKYVNKLSLEEIRDLVCCQLLLTSENSIVNNIDFLREVLITNFERNRSHLNTINELPLYPTEKALFSEVSLSSVYYSGKNCIALPKLNLQFLSFSDYLLRNFILFQLESTHAIREDICDVVNRISLTEDEMKSTSFIGWSRMGVPIKSFKIAEVKCPDLGKKAPSSVLGQIVYSVSSYPPSIRTEWDNIRQQEVLFLISLKPSYLVKNQNKFAASFGLTYVRGCEIIEIRDESDKLMNVFSGSNKFEEWKEPFGFKRTVEVSLDPVQYMMDTSKNSSESDDVYNSFKLLIRRDSKENNFKVVLETIKELMNEGCVVPEWLHDILLGYGDPNATQIGLNSCDKLKTNFDIHDTLLDELHAFETLGNIFSIDLINSSNKKAIAYPFRFEIHGCTSLTDLVKNCRLDLLDQSLRINNSQIRNDISKNKFKITLMTCGHKSKAVYQKDKAPKNTTRFTIAQLQAIVTGLQLGLTIIVGPPGTGKTDSATQILHLLYQNHHKQRTLLVAHSNQALNDIFQKITERNVSSRHLLRLGLGEEDLDVEQSFSKIGRVNAVLKRRLELLAEVERLGKVLGIPGSKSHAFTCDSSGYFWFLHILARWEKFTLLIQESRGILPSNDSSVLKLFPYTSFFTDVTRIFCSNSIKQDMNKALSCFKYLKNIFLELEIIRPFEILRSQADRVDYLMTKQSKIVAMTCTHAALKRKELIKLGFRYDSLLVEEAARILEIETFLPMLLQKKNCGNNPLKRIILIGDQHQLPPIVRNSALQKYSHLDQSLFARLIRLGVPYIELNSQGRARPTLAKLYNWRYKHLYDLPCVFEKEFRYSNPGFVFDYQLIDVQDFQGQGESEPTPYFYQNLAEAELLVTVYQYMRLLGYPAWKITILTTYNGQKTLIRDVIDKQCAKNFLFGRPCQVTTVDKFQGQQSDYVLLSLVRTRNVGYLKDVRRLVVAMSRARVGLYIFCRVKVFKNCHEIKPTLQQLLARPNNLALITNEKWGENNRKIGDKVNEFIPVPDLSSMSYHLQFLLKKTISFNHNRTC
jgi:intron-binding protein aquarius